MVAGRVDRFKFELAKIRWTDPTYVLYLFGIVTRCTQIVFSPMCYGVAERKPVANR